MHWFISGSQITYGLESLVLGTSKIAKKMSAHLYERHNHNFNPYVIWLFQTVPRGVFYEGRWIENRQSVHSFIKWMLEKVVFPTVAISSRRESYWLPGWVFIGLMYLAKISTVLATRTMIRPYIINFHCCMLPPSEKSFFKITLGPISPYIPQS